MNLAEQYKIEATNADGTPFEVVGGKLSGAAMASFVPGVPGLKRHDVVGMNPVRCFGRAFLKGMGGGMKEYLHCVVCKDCRVYVKATDGTVLVTPPDYELYI